MAKKLEVTRSLERQAERRRHSLGDAEPAVDMLNLPAAFLCERSCAGCIANHDDIAKKEMLGRLPRWSLYDVISLFAKRFGTRHITINGRGDPLHPLIRNETLGKINYAFTLGLGAYLFTSGSNLDIKACRLLAAHKTNVMISLFGNRFIDAGFFEGKRYEGEKGRIAANIRMLMHAYKATDEPGDGLTRIGMNYVVQESDLERSGRLRKLHEAAADNGIFFICNTSFSERCDTLREFARENSDFSLPHSTAVDGICQMGAGASITVAANGDIYRCPYMLEGSDGNIRGMTEEGIRAIIARHRAGDGFACTLRKTKAG